jgi:hypothetical protein
MPSKTMRSVAGGGLLMALALTVTGAPGPVPARQAVEVSPGAAPFVAFGVPMGRLKAALETVGAAITHELPVIGGYGARLTPSQAARLLAEGRTCGSSRMGP